MRMVLHSFADAESEAAAVIMASAAAARIFLVCGVIVLAPCGVVD
jgi:hypothetical protein